VKQKIKETIKSILIIILLIISIVQVGILWGYQSHRLPTAVFASFFGGSDKAVSSREVRENLFVPYKIVLSDGYGSHWIVESKDKNYQQVWGEGEKILEGIALKKYSQYSSLPESEWSNVTLRAGISFEFKYQISPALLNWFAKTSGSSIIDGDLIASGAKDTDLEGVPTVWKIKIVPGVGNSMNEAFVNDGEGNVYRYVLGSITRETEFRELLAIYEEDSEKGQVREYTTMADSNLAEKLGAPPDSLYVIKTRYWSYNNINVSNPRGIGNPVQLAESILGANKERYTENIYSNGTVQFNTSDSLYRVSGDGLLEYSYLKSTSSADKGRLDTALVHAYTLISRVSDLLRPGAELFISDIDDSNSHYYTFRFDYRVNGLPVYVRQGESDEESGEGEAVEENETGNLASAVEISANGSGVIKCRWILRDFSIAASGSYNDRFLDIMSGVSEGDAPKEIANLGIAYVLDISDAAETVEITPTMVVEEKGSGRIKSFSLPEEVQ
jgi:hypothetical protein